jgi:hypothetical protein
MNHDQTSPESERSLRVYTRKLKRHPIFRQMKWPVDVVKRSVPSAWRFATQSLRHLPTVVIVGAQKAGTTQLYTYLVRHPRVMAGCKKEVDYFSKQPDRSVEWYRSRFPLTARVAWRGGHVLEASPSYLPMPRALRQMKSVLPEAQVIVLLRDPVSRAFSHYQHRKTRHLETRSFEQAVSDELRNNDLLPAPGAAMREDAPPMLDYVARGYYALQLEVLYSLYPRENVLVMDSAALFADTSAACHQVFQFLGVEAFDVRPSKVFNRGYYQEKIDPRVAERLRAHYGPYDALLAQMLGRRMSWAVKKAA